MLKEFHQYGFQVRVVVDSLLAGGDWNCYIVGYDALIGPPWSKQGNSEEHYLLIGVERWHQLGFEMMVKPEILETDSGPLDAKV